MDKIVSICLTWVVILGVPCCIYYVVKARNKKYTEKILLFILITSYLIGASNVSYQFSVTREMNRVMIASFRQCADMLDLGESELLKEKVNKFVNSENMNKSTYVMSKEFAKTILGYSNVRETCGLYFFGNIAKLAIFLVVILLIFGVMCYLKLKKTRLAYLIICNVLSLFFLVSCITLYNFENDLRTEFVRNDLRKLAIALNQSPVQDNLIGTLRYVKSFNTSYSYLEALKVEK